MLNKQSFSIKSNHISKMVDSDNEIDNKEESSQQQADLSIGSNSSNSLNPGVSLEERSKEEKYIDDEEDSTFSPLRVRRFATVMNLLNSLLGAGVLSVPSSFSNVGLIPSIILLFLIALLSYIATALIFKLQLETKTAGFDELAFAIGGKVWQVILSILTLIFLVAALLAYLILGGDMLTSWFALVDWDMEKLWPRAGMILIYSLVLPIALSIPRSIRVLSYFSTATVFFILLFVISMVVKAIIHFPKYGVSKSVTYGRFDMKVFQAISVYGLAFSLPIVSLPIVNNYRHNVRKRKIVGLAATALCFVLIVIPSVVGYLMFGEETDGNVLKNFDDSDILMTIVRIGFFFVVSFSYPIVAQPVMGSWSQIIYKENDASTLPTKKRVVVQIITHVIPVIIAMFLPEAKPILAVGGAIGGCLVDFSYPPLLWFLYYRPPYVSATFAGIVLFIIFGLVTGVISTYQSVLDVIDSFKTVKS